MDFIKNDQLCSRIVVLEGPDGGGKSTMAKLLVQALDAHYVHLGPFPQLDQNSFNRMLVEAVTPALLGHKAMVLDRSWPSEQIYGEVHRGKTRTSPTQARQLARLFMRCGAAQFIFLPPLDQVLDTHRARKRLEYIKDQEVLKLIYRRYKDLLNQESHLLPTMGVDYTQPGPLAQHLLRFLSNAGGRPHPLSVRSAGNMDGEVVLVGESFAHHKSCDPLYQWPFGSFSQMGCSYWLSKQLEDHGISERRLLWINADEVCKMYLDKPKFIPEYDLENRVVIALGEEASATLRSFGIKHEATHHPQYWARFKRMKSAGTYPLIDLIKSHLAGVKHAG